MYTMFIGKPGWHIICAGLLVSMLIQAGSCKGSSQEASSATNRNAASSNQSKTKSMKSVPANTSMNKSSNQQSSAANTNETWGGNHVRMVTKPGGADLEFDCARGELSAELKPDKDGNFDIEGTISSEGGPTRLDETSNGRPVRYVGRITHDSMTFQIHFKDSSETSETFTLTRGNEGRLRKCK
jgi:hypothetical protein